MANIYEIEYKYADEYIKGEPSHNALVCVYETGTDEGDKIQAALDQANETDDWSVVDKILTTLFDVKDDYVCFYFDINDILDKGTSRLTKLVPELQKDFGIVIKDIWVERSSI